MGSLRPPADVDELDLGPPSAALLIGLGALLFVNYKPAWQEDREHDRERQAAALLEAVRDHPGPVVVAGDLDATPDAPSIQRLRDAGCRDAWTPRSPGHTFEQRRIDYVFVRGDVEVASCRLALEGASDHLGVVADLAL